MNGQRDILSELVGLETVINRFTNFYPEELSIAADRIWEAFGKSDIPKILSAVDYFTILIPNRVWVNSRNNGLKQLLDFSTFDSKLTQDLVTKKRKVTSLEDL